MLSEEQFKDLAARAVAKGLEIPSYPALDAQRKVSAAWLVERGAALVGIDSLNIDGNKANQTTASNCIRFSSPAARAAWAAN